MISFERFMCKIGLHQYSRPKCFVFSHSKVEDWSKYCCKCGKVKKWTIAKVEVKE